MIPIWKGLFFLTVASVYFRKIKRELKEKTSKKLIVIIRVKIYKGFIPRKISILPKRWQILTIGVVVFLSWLCYDLIATWFQYVMAELLLRTFLLY